MAVLGIIGLSIITLLGIDGVICLFVMDDYEAYMDPIKFKGFAYLFRKIFKRKKSYSDESCINKISEDVKNTEDLRKKSIERDVEIQKKIAEMSIQLEINKRKLEQANKQLRDTIRKNVIDELSDLEEILDPEEFKSIVDDEVEYRWNERKKSH